MKTYFITAMCDETDKTPLGLKLTYIEVEDHQTEEDAAIKFKNMFNSKIGNTYITYMSRVIKNPNQWESEWKFVNE